LNNLVKTISDCTMFFFGRAGIFWHLIRQGALYFNPGFYPSELEDHVKINQWLMNNQGRLRLYAQTHLPQPESTRPSNQEKG
jgi:predicted metal-dependent hydrolase